MPTNNKLTPEEIAEKLESIKDYGIDTYPERVMHAVIEQLQRQLAEARNQTVPMPPKPKSSLSQATLRIHNSPESAFSALYGVDFAEIDSIGGVDGKGEETECDPKAAMDGMRMMGLWGCCHPDSATVYVWASPEASDSYLLMLLGHELGHIIKDGPFEVSTSSEHVPEEQDADRYGWAATEAYRMLRIIRPSPDLEAIRREALLEFAIAIESEEPSRKMTFRDAAKWVRNMAAEEGGQK